jgi:hypothetical protein
MLESMYVYSLFSFLSSAAHMKLAVRKSHLLPAGVWIVGLFLLYLKLREPTAPSIVISETQSLATSLQPKTPKTAGQVLRDLKYPPFDGEEVPPNSDCYIFSPLGVKKGKGVLFFAFGLVYINLTLRSRKKRRNIIKK